MIDISIVIPCYNSGKYINKTLDSLINQTYKNFEIIVVDDGSTDDSSEIIISKLKNTDIKFQIIKQENSGVSKARNTGIAKSSGEYIYLIDSDDYINENFIEIMYRKIISDNLDVVFCGFSMIEEKSNSILYKYDDNFNYLYSNVDGIEAIEKALKSEIHLCTGSAIYKKNMLLEHEVEYSLNCTNGEDQEFWMKALYSSNKVGSVNKILFYYLQRSGSITHTASLDRFTALGAIMRLKKFLKDNNANKSIIKYIETNKYQKEFMANFISIIKLCENESILMPIVKNKNNIEMLKKFKIYKMSISDFKTWINIKLYILKPEKYIHIIRRNR